jgi:hypothetical protein
MARSAVELPWEDEPSGYTENLEIWIFFLIIGCKKLLDDLKDRRGYCHLKEEALDRTVWRNRFGRGFGPVV